MGSQAIDAQKHIEFHFDDKKAAQAAAYILKIHGGRMTYMVLIKLLYLADRAQLMSRGRTITGDTMYSMKCGPVLSIVMNILKRDPRTSISLAWEEHISEPVDTYDVTLLSPAPTDELSRNELKTLDEVHNRFGHMNDWDLVDLLHEILPEYEKVQSGRSLILPDRILRHAGATDEQIAHVRAEVESLTSIDSMLR
jgi:uncharacterized phage-associated protein